MSWQNDARARYLVWLDRAEETQDRRLDHDCRLNLALLDRSPEEWELYRQRYGPRTTLEQMGWTPPTFALIDSGALMQHWETTKGHPHTDNFVRVVYRVSYEMILATERGHPRNLLGETIRRALTSEVLKFENGTKGRYPSLSIPKWHPDPGWSPRPTSDPP